MNQSISWLYWRGAYNPGPRTNNHIEAYHLQLKKLIGVAHPNIFSFVEAIKFDHDNYDTKLIQVLDDAIPNPRSHKRAELEAQLTSYIRNYLDGNIWPLSDSSIEQGEEIN